MTESISAEGLKEALLKGAEYLSANQRILDNLNVFPVPDGDTGANMVATLQAGIRALGDSAVSSIGDISRCMKDELLRNSRGNSGFIIAWFFSGFFSVVERYERLTKDGLHEGFAAGAYQVNSSLFTPVEGTMITIIASMTRALRDCASLDLGGCLREALSAGRESLFDTPRMLPLLAKAGVVDSGALGFIFIVEGMLRGLAKEEVAAEREDSYRFKPDPGALRNWEPLPEHRYCTEVYVAEPRDRDEDALRGFLRERGSSIALVWDPRFIKLHIHTDDPEGILRRLGDFGTIERSKVEDMREQVELLSAREKQDCECSVLACVPGPGFVEVFEGLGAAACLSYGRELPSAGAILEALSELEAPAVILLPNNGNILPAALLARELCGKEVSILPTRNVVEGIAAAYGYSENESMRENLRGMEDCRGLAESLLVYRSASSSAFGELLIPEGHYFALRGDAVLAMDEELPKALLEALEAAGAAGKANIVLYTGEGFDASLLPAIEEGIAALNPALEIEIREGGQPRELLIISLE
jgi:DAK2 domain fusion protein YloV